MAAIILDGNKIAAMIKEEVEREVRAMGEHGVRPGMAIVIVGDQAASETYLRNKLRACAALGIYTEMKALPETITTVQLTDELRSLSARDDIDGILVEMPLPAHIDSGVTRMAIDPMKDIDGIHPVNAGLIGASADAFAPCTPAAVMEILRRSKVQMAGAEAVVAGRSDVVGKPAAALLLRQNATVTVCHSKTRDLPGVCRRADILVAAIGRAGMITRDFVKPGATVIDVGINHIADKGVFERLFKGDEKREQQFATRGSVLAGDVHPEVAEVAGALTPVPGGVGPLTVVMSMVNTLKAARLRRGLPRAAAERA